MTCMCAMYVKRPTMSDARLPCRAAQLQRALIRHYECAHDACAHAGGVGRKVRRVSALSR